MNVHLKRAMERTLGQSGVVAFGRCLRRDNVLVLVYHNFRNRFIDKIFGSISSVTSVPSQTVV
jgi:hypothetical protein